MLTRRTEWADWPNFGFGDFSPFSAFEQLRRQVDRAFSDVDRGRSAARFGLPHISLEDAGDKFVVMAELPGLSEKDVELNVTSNSLSLSGYRQAEAPAGYTVHRKERSDYRFSRSFSLPVKVDPDKAEATMKNGILTIVLPKAPDARPKQIAVKAS
jgi:HSP20 family protein